MQDFRPFAGRVFGGGWPAAAQHQHQQPAKCPRCESTNTKFCYYNNYNLAQPRHFCKACRRYWTKGGVLRNVPVGGGCRKSKRPSSSSSSSKATSQTSANGAAPSDSRQHRRPRLLSFSSDPISDVSTAVATHSTSVPVHDPTPADPPLEPMGPPFCPAPQIFPDPPAMGLAFSDPPRAKSKAAPFVDQAAVPADPTPRGTTAAWPGGSLDPHLFDLPSAVDPSPYWNQSHWMDADHTLYLP